MVRTLLFFHIMYLFTCSFLYRPNNRNSMFLLFINTLTWISYELLIYVRSFLSHDDKLSVYALEVFKSSEKEYLRNTLNFINEISFYEMYTGTYESKNPHTWCLAIAVFLRTYWPFSPSFPSTTIQLKNILHIGHSCNKDLQAHHDAGTGVLRLSSQPSRVQI